MNRKEYSAHRSRVMFVEIERKCSAILQRRHIFSFFMSLLSNIFFFFKNSCHCWPTNVLEHWIDSGIMHIEILVAYGQWNFKH